MEPESARHGGAVRRVEAGAGAAGPRRRHRHRRKESRHAASDRSMVT